MNSRANSEVAIIERRSLRWLFLFSCLFILYGTSIPFQFSLDPALVENQWLRFLTPPWINGVRQFSIPDAVSNVALFVPFGFFFIGSEYFATTSSRWHGSVAAAGLLGVILSSLVEFGQLFSPDRTASLMDIVCNGTGAVLGGILGYGFMRALRGSLGALLFQTIRDRPSILILLLIVLMWSADAFYPFRVTLDVSTVWRNVKNTQWIPFAGESQRLWLDLAIENVIPFAAVGFLLYTNLRTSVPRPAWLAWWLSSALAFGIEAGKLFFTGRSPNATTFALASLGALLGAMLVPRVASTSFSRRHVAAILTCLMTSIIVWAYLAPFDWVESIGELSARTAAVEWIPFSSYYGANPLKALFDFGKKLYLIVPLGFLIAIQLNPPWRRPVSLAIGLVLGITLETSQLALRSRTPAVTDLLLFGAAAWFGALVFERYLALKKAADSSSNRQLT